VLAAALEILRTVYGNIEVIEAFASWALASDLAIGALEEIVIFVGVVAETFGRRTHCLADRSFGIVPTGVKSILRYLRIVFLVFLKFLLRHEHSPVIADQIAVFDVFVDMLCAASACRFANLHQYIIRTIVEWGIMRKGYLATNQALNPLASIPCPESILETGLF
jgi:hypothetical protein